MLIQPQPRVESVSASGVLRPSQPRLSVVLAVFNEQDNVLPVLKELRAALAGTDGEIVVVDDGSQDGTIERVHQAMAEDPGLRVVRLGRRCGKSAALLAGVRRAAASLIVTMDGDGQNDPADIVALVEAARAGGSRLGLVAGQRRQRRDVLARRLASRLANGLRQALLRDGCRDTACGLKAIRRDVFLELPAFDGMHRFLPALCRIRGYEVAYVTVGDRPRLSGRSKYGNLSRALVGFPDLLGVAWLRWRTTVPPAVTTEPPGWGRSDGRDC